MGLREQNAARARETMVRAAMKLFFDLGYDATTMEEIAQSADVGSSTLYRYFDSKEALLLAPLGEPGLMAAEVAAAPAGEPLADVLGHAVTALLSLPRDEVTGDPRFHELITTNPRAQSRLLQWYQAEERRLREAIAARESLDPDGIGVQFAARSAMLVLELATRDLPPGTPREQVAESARRVMRELAKHDVTMPRVRE